MASLLGLETGTQATTTSKRTRRRPAAADDSGEV